MIESAKDRSKLDVSNDIIFLIYEFISDVIVCRNVRTF